MEATIVEDCVPTAYNEVEMECQKRPTWFFDVETRDFLAIYNDLIRAAASKMQ